MVRYVLFLILFTVIARMFWRVVDNIIEAAGGQPPRGRNTSQSVPMVRDPICGTFVLPDRAVSLVSGRDRVYFCSDACRDKYEARRTA